MPQIINTNIASLTAQRNLNSSQSANRTALERLSSGLRINSAKDDAAGLAISTRFSSQIRGLSVAIRNAGDGISLAQTAEGALDSISSSLQRLRELALQSSNATNSDVDREALNAEAQQLISEITRTGEQTDFNGTNLLDGNFNASFQVGANAGETVTFGIAELTASNLGGGRTAGVSAIGSSAGLANGDLVINGAVVGPSVASDDTASFANSPASAISKVAAINRATEQSGVKAEVLTNIAAGSVQNETSGGTNATTGSITLNGVEISVATGDVDESADRSGIVAAINARSGETGVTAVDTGTRFGGVNLEAVDGRNITVQFSSGNLSAASTGLTSTETTSGGYTLSSETSGTAIVISESTGDISNSGLVAGTYTANTAAVATSVRTSEDGAPTSQLDTPAVAASVSSSGIGTLGNYSGVNTLEFDVTISNADTNTENGSVTVSINSDLTGGTVQDLADAINSSIDGAIAATASVGSDGNLQIARNTAEAGSLEIRNYGDNNLTTSSVVASALGITENASGEGANIVAADTVIDAVAASTTGGSPTDTSALGVTVLSAANTISFDLSVSGAASQAAQTVTVTLDASSGINSLTTTSELADAINTAIGVASTTIGVTASVDDSNSLVFTRNSAEAGVLEVSNIDGGGAVTDAVASQVLGYAVDDSNGNGTISTNGANATTVGAVNAAANYYSTGNSFEAGAASASTLTFETGSAESAVLAIGAGTGTTPTSTGINLTTAGVIEFELSLDNGESFTVTTAASVGVTDATQAELVSSLNTALNTATTALGLGTGQVFASFTNNELSLETGAKGSSKSLEITAVTGSPASDTLGLTSAVGTVASGLGGTEAAKVTIAQGNTPDFGFDFNGSVTQLQTGDNGSLVDRDNLSFDVSYNNGTTITNDTITIDSDSSPRGAQLVVDFGTILDGDGAATFGAGSALDGSGAFLALTASDVEFDLVYNGVTATVANTTAAATGAALVADLQAAVDGALGAVDLGFGAINTYTAGDVKVSIDASNNLVLTATNTNGETTLGIANDAGINGADIASVTTGDGAAYTVAATGAAVEVTGGAYAGDAAAQVRFTGGTFDNTYDFSAANASATFNVSYSANGTSTDAVVELNADLGSDNSDALAAIQTALDAAIGSQSVIVSLDSDKGDLVFTSVDRGSDVELSISGFSDDQAANAGLTAFGATTTSSFSASGSDFDADGAFLETVNDKLAVSNVSGVTASIDSDNNLVFTTAATGSDVEVSVGNFVGSSNALSALGVSGTERAVGAEIAQDVGLSATASAAGGEGATGVDLFTGTGGEAYDFSISFNGGDAVRVTSASGETDANAANITNATSNQLVQSIQTALDTALSANIGDGANGYTDGDVVVSINNGGEVVFTNTRTDANSSLEIVSGNFDGGVTGAAFSATGVVSSSNYTAAGAQASVKEATGTTITDFDFDFGTNNASFDLTFNDGSGGPDVTGTVTFGTQAANTADALVTQLQADIDAVTDNNGDITVSLDKDGFLSFTSGNNTGAAVTFTVDNFQDASGTGGLAKLGLGDGSTTPYANLTFTATGTDTNIVTSPTGTIENDTGTDQPAQNNTLTVSGLQGGDETVTLEGSFSNREGIVSELNSKLTNATASLDDSGVITITDNDVTQASEGNTVGVSGNAAIDLGFDGNGNASAGIINENAGSSGNETLAIRSLLDGDIRINGVSIAASRASDDTASNELANSSNKAASGIAIAAAINRSTETTGVSAEVNATVVSGGTTNTDRTADGDAGVVYVNGISTGTLSLGADKETNRANAISAINQIAGQTGVTAADNGGGITLTAADGRNLSVAIDTLGTNFTGENIGLDASVKGIAEADFAAQGLTYADVAATTSSTIRFESSSEFTVAAGTNGAVGDDGFGGLEGLGIKAGTYGGAESGQFLNEVDISTVDGALSALDALDNALSSVSSERANLGAIQNRLQSTIDNLSISVENLQSANSRILDADFAAETAELSRTQVLQQAGISILAQANAAPQQVLSLLQ
jgi:flagellin